MQGKSCRTIIAAALPVFWGLASGVVVAETPAESPAQDNDWRYVCLADFDGSGGVDFPDFLALAAVFGLEAGDGNYNGLMDLDGSGRVDFPDFVAFAAVFGGQCEKPRLMIPLGGEEGKDWFTGGYVDLDRGPAVRDYRGGDRGYNGHTGTDMGVPNFRWMDRDFPPVLVAAAGRVSRVRGGLPDREVGGPVPPENCGGNEVYITHPGGWETRYAHLKKGSILVSVGDTVAALDTLGVVGSSGCSSGPHLHFEILDPDGNVLCPFAEDMWLTAPSYDWPLTLADYLIKDGTVESADLSEPAPNISAMRAGELLGVGLFLIGGGPGESFQLLLEDAGGIQRGEWTLTFPNPVTSTVWIWNWYLTGHPGTWNIWFRINGETVGKHSLRATVP